MARVVSVNISDQKRVSKTPVPEIELMAGLGVRTDAHAAPGDRQVSLLMIESIREAHKDRAASNCGKIADGLELGPGSFAENITTEGIDLIGLKLGDELRIGAVRLRLTKIGKECHERCSIYYKLGDCIMPRQGIFFEVVAGGRVRPGDEIVKD